MFAFVIIIRNGNPIFGGTLRVLNVDNLLRFFFFQNTGVAKQNRLADWTPPRILACNLRGAVPPRFPPRRASRSIADHQPGPFETAPTSSTSFQPVNCLMGNKCLNQHSPRPRSHTKRTETTNLHHHIQVASLFFMAGGGEGLLKQEEERKKENQQKADRGTHCC